MTDKQAIADLLWRAEQTRQACTPVRDFFTEQDPRALIDAAYAVQRINIERQLAEGRRVVGRKIGLTSLAVQRQLGVDSPDFGTLLDSMSICDGEEIQTSRLLQPKVEAELALVLERDLTHEKHSVADIIGATAYALASIEVVASRIEGWNIRLVDTVADNASSGLFVLGTQPMKLSKLDLVGMKMAMHAGDTLVSEGQGSACLGNPLHAACWLADTMVRAGTPLRAGDIVLTGALGPMAAVVPGTTYTARIEGFTPVRAIFSQE
jgi:2-keto-4-pentenoate hydratase